VKAMGAGSCEVYVLTSNSIWDTVSVTVDANPTKVKLGKVNKNLAPGDVLDLGAGVTIKPQNAITTLAWSSSDPAVAVVNESGVVMAVAPGKATITVTTDNGKTARVKLKVK